MLELGQWEAVDNIFFIAQITLVVRFYIQNVKYTHSSLIAGGLALSQLFLISPNTKLVFGSARDLPLWRFEVDAARLAGLERIRFLDIILMVIFLGLCVLEGLKLLKLTFRVQFPIGIVILTGILGSTNVVYDFDLVRFFLTLKIFLIAITFINLGALMAKKGVNPAGIILLDQFLIISVIGITSMLLLKSEYRWGRYGANNFVPSPGIWMIPFTYILVLIFNQAKLEKWKRVTIILSFVSMLWVPSKTIYMECVGLAAIIFAYRINFKLLFRLESASKIWAALILISSFFPLIILRIGNPMMDKEIALHTRQVQIINVESTLVEQGLLGVAIGIGHGQWYKISRDFDEFDTGAWSLDEVEENNFKAGTQVPLLAILRSAGIFGLIAFLAHCYIIAEKGCAAGIGRESLGFKVCMTFIFVSIISQMPELGFESVAIPYLNMGYLITKK